MLNSGCELHNWAKNPSPRIKQTYYHGVFLFFISFVICVVILTLLFLNSGQGHVLTRNELLEGILGVIWRGCGPIRQLIWVETIDIPLFSIFCSHLIAFGHNVDSRKCFKIDNTISLSMIIHYRIFGHQGKTCEPESWEIEIISVTAHTTGHNFRVAAYVYLFSKIECEHMTNNPRLAFITLASITTWPRGHLSWP